MALDVRHLCIAVIRHFQEAVLTDIRNRSLQILAPPIGKFSWTIVVNNDAAKSNVIKILPEVSFIGKHVAINLLFHYKAAKKCLIYCDI